MENNCFKIKLRRDCIHNVCKKLQQFESEFDVGTHRTMIDGKDIRGFYALDTSKTLNVECLLRKNETMKQVMDSLKDYVVND